MATGRIPINGTAAIQSTIVDAKGDLIAGTGSDAVARLAVGANGTTLVADSSTATGLKWVTAGGGGKVLQVVNATYSTPTSSSSSTFADTGLTATITPTLATSKVLVYAVQNGCSKSAGNSANNLEVELRRDSTTIQKFASGMLYTGSAITLLGFSAVGICLDTPATTSALTYKTRFKSGDNTSSVTVQDNSTVSSIILMEIGV